MLRGGRRCAQAEPEDVHPLSSNESEALDRVGEEYLGCFERVRSRRFDDDDDRALYELGGEENVTAG